MLYNVGATESHLDVIDAIIIAHTIVLSVDQTELDTGQTGRNGVLHTKLMPGLLSGTCRGTLTRLDQNSARLRIDELHVELRRRSF